MLTEPISLVGWALFLIMTVLVFSRGNKQLVRIYENRLRQVLTRRGMTIESLNSRAGFFDTMDVIEFEVIFTTPRGRRIQGIILVGDRWSRLLFRDSPISGPKRSPQAGQEIAEDAEDFVRFIESIVRLDRTFPEIVSGKRFHVQPAWAVIEKVKTQFENRGGLRDRKPLLQLE